MTNELRGKHRWRLAGSALLVALAAGELAAQDGVRAWGSGRFASDAFHRPVVHLDAYASTCCLLHNDGRVQVIGATTLPDAPPAPTGTPYTQVAVGMSSSWTPVGFALLTNGSIVSWGANGTGAPAPAL
ncbi:MAG: hypothetical protein Q7T30_03640, partial [Planctomycetota bacterium]|nr:hypothetical protein [Planctomycetota bacterium]